MSRLRKRHVEALRALTEEVERMDFIQKHCAHLSHVEDHWYCFLHTGKHTAHSGDQPTAREAVDACRAEVQRQQEEARTLARWKTAFAPNPPSAIRNPKSK